MSQGRDTYRNAVRIVHGRLDRVGRAVAIELGGRLIRRTPIDTGRARGNWNASIGKEDPRTDPDRRANTALSEGAERIAPLKLSVGHRLFWTNGLPYIARLNDGYSRQAPSGYVQLTVQEMRVFVDQVAARENLRG